MRTSYVDARALAFLKRALVPLSIVALVACSHAAPKRNVVQGSIIVRSNAFEQGGHVPDEFTCKGADVSPPLVWSNLPPGTQSLDLLMYDLDAQLFVHWRVDGIPAGVNSTEQGVDPPGRVGRNGFKTVGYRGPCPPSGSHRYVIEVRAFAAPNGVGTAIGSGTLQASYP